MMKKNKSGNLCAVIELQWNLNKCIEFNCILIFNKKGLYLLLFFLLFGVFFGIILVYFLIKTPFEIKIGNIFESCFGFTNWRMLTCGVFDDDDEFELLTRVEIQLKYCIPTRRRNPVVSRFRPLQLWRMK